MRDQQSALQSLVSVNHLADALIICYARMVHPQDKTARLYIAWAANMDDATLLDACRTVFGSRLGILLEETANELLNQLIDSFEIHLDQSTSEHDILLFLIDTFSVYGSIHRLQCLTELPAAPKLPHIDHCVRRAKRYAMSIQQELTHRLAAM